MRLRMLTLERFGQFTGKAFDFGPRPAEGPDFHVIHGANEAGKTTTMEGFLRLLYGFPQRDPYAFRHERKLLQVSGRLETSERSLSVTRLPNAPFLVDEAGQPLSEQALSAPLGGLGLSAYRNLLCLDDDTIEAGGEEIAQAQGDIGRLLFSAAAGIGALTAVLDDLRDRADALYRKNSSKTEMAALRREMTEIDRAIRESDVSAGRWDGLRKTLDEAQRAETEAQARRAAHAKRRAGLEAKRDARPVLAEIDALEARIAADPLMPDSMEIDPETLIELETRAAQARADHDRLGEEIAALTAERAALAPDEEGLALATRHEGLEAAHRRYVSALEDLPKRRRELSELREEMRSAGRDLGVPAGIDPEALVLGEAEIAALDTAREALVSRREAEDAARHALGTLDERLGRLRAELGTLPEAGSGIEALLARHGTETLATRHAAAEEALSRGAEDLAGACDALELGSKRFDVPPVVTMAPEEARALSEAHARAVIDEERAEAAIADLTAARAETRARIAALEEADGLVSDEAAAALLETRDRLWSQHRKTPGAKSADAFESAMRAVDEAAAARLSRARDLAQLRDALREAAALEARLAEARASREALAQKREDLWDRVAEAARQAGFDPPPPPGVFATWMQRLAEARRAEQTLDRLRATHAGVMDRAARLTEALAGQLALETPDFDSALAAARTAADAERRIAETRRNAETRAEALALDQAQAATALERASEERDHAELTWTRAVARALGETVDPLRLLGAPGPLRALRERDRGRAATARQIAAMERDEAAFAHATAALPLPDAPADPAERFAALGARVTSARATRDRIAALGEAIAQREAERSETTRISEGIARRAASVAALFPPGAGPADPSDLGALRRRVSAAREVIEARHLRARRVSALCNRLGCETLEAARAALSGLDAIALDAALLELGEETDAIETGYREAIAARSAAAAALSAVTGDDSTARLIERKAVLGLRMEEVALGHLVLDFGHRLGEEAIRRYRDTHRSAMMQAAESAFLELTAGRHVALRSQIEGGAERLVALDADGVSRRSDDLSKGTRFQLYLALRVAAYEELARQGMSLPFFCDDIFETFDETRTEAACRVLARLGRSGQTIYLTHHAHVVEIARSVCGDGVTLHRL